MFASRANASTLCSVISSPDALVVLFQYLSIAFFFFSWMAVTYRWYRDMIANVVVVRVTIHRVFADGAS